MFANLWRKIRGSRTLAASKRLPESRKSRRLFFEPLENRNLLATIVVTGTGDTIDAADGLVTLREAITAANTNAASGDAPAGDAGLDTINFNIAGSGVHTISPATALPPISDPVFINGYSQPGSSKNTNAIDDPDPTKRGFNGTLQIEIDGTATGASGLVISAGNSTVRGLVINRFQGAGIHLSSNGNVVAGNFIGTSATGDADLGNGAIGVDIIDAFNNTIVDASNNTIGGMLPADRNLISGNNSAGVRIIAFGSADQSNITGNQVLGNLIGTDKAGTAAISNNVGVLLESVFGGHVTGNLIGGTTAAARNVISGNESANVNFGADFPTLLQPAGNRVQGNFVGTDVTGTVGFAVGFPDGIRLEAGTANNLIGGDDAADGVVDGIVGAANVISGNAGVGVVIHSSGNHVEGNRIGTNAAGTAPLPNGFGVVIGEGAGNTVGGAAPGAGNLISGNSQIGLQFVNADNNVVQGNRIGTDVTGVNPLPNGSNGLNIRGNFPVGSENNLIGGTAAGEGNIIAFNLRGVAISSPAIAGIGTGNSILGNSIFANSQLGIDLGGGDLAGDGVTDNDQNAFPFDTDTGPNNLQDFPDLASVTSNNGTTTILGTLKSTASTEFRIEFFANAAADPSGFGEGQTFLGSVTIADGGAGDTDPTAGIIGFSFQTPTPTGNFFTATATRTNGDGGLIETSEFSAAISPAAPEGVDLAVTKTDSPDPVTAGNNLTYTISLSNAGLSDATNVSLGDALPANTSFVSATQTGGPTFSLAGPIVGGTNTFTATVGTFAGGATATFTLVVHVNANTPDDTTLTNTATVTSTTPDTNSANNSATESTQVNTEADLQVTKSAGSGVVVAGGNVTYTITLTNQGPSDAQSPSISDVLPAGTTFVSFAPPGGFTATTPAVNGTGTVTASAAVLAAGQSAAFQLVVSVGSGTAAGTSVTNTAEASTATADTNLANNSASATVQVENPVAPTALTITLVSRQARYRNEFGLFIVDDASGRIGNLLPGAAGYARAALSRAKVVFAANTKIGTSRTVNLPAGSSYGLYLIQNANAKQFLARNPTNRLSGKLPLMFFSFRAANPDGFEHLRQPSPTQYAFEDMTSGGDQDFNDVIVDIRAQTGAAPALQTSARLVRRR